MSCTKANRPTISAILLVSLLSFASCQDLQAVMMNNPNGLQVAWNPESSSVGVWRRLQPVTTPAPTDTTPSATTTTTTTTPASTQTISTTAPPTGSTTPPPSTTPLPPPTTTTAAPVPITGRINVTMCSIQEMDSNSSTVAAFNAFQTIGLGGSGTLKPPVMVASLPGSSGQTAVQATCQSAVGSIPLTNSTSNPIFNVTVCLVTASGSVSYDNEMIPMMAGQLVAMIGVQNWQWTSTGVSLMLNLTITAPNGRQVSVNSQNGSTYMNMSLGATNSYALLSSKIISDFKNYLPMATGYPTISMINDNKQSASILVMMPKLAGPQTTWTGLIDPGYTPAGPPPGPVSAAVRLHGVITNLLFALVCCTSVMSFFRQ